MATPTPPPQTRGLGGAVSLTLRGVELERSTSEDFTSYSVMVEGVCAWVLGGGGTGEEDSSVRALVLCGPFESARWVPGTQPGHSVLQEDKVIEGFLSFPTESRRGETVSAWKLCSVSSIVLN